MHGPGCGLSCGQHHKCVRLRGLSPIFDPGGTDRERAMAHDADLGERGFTLLELMITLAVMAVLAVIAIPSYKGLTQRNALATAATSLVGSLYFARGQAIMQGHPVVLCKSADGIDCSDSGGWDQCWIIYAALEGLITTGPDA